MTAKMVKTKDLPKNVGKAYDLIVEMIRVNNIPLDVAISAMMSLSVQLMWGAGMLEDLKKAMKDIIEHYAKKDPKE
mgnify:CR=1 FL=1